MEIYKHDNEIEIRNIVDFDLEKTFECGQCFRWNKDEAGDYTGIVNNKAVKLRKCDDSIFISCCFNDFNEIWRKYFDLDRDYYKIRQQLCIDDFMKNATTFGAGIRLLRQDKWEALCSFIISQNNNIPRIKKIINTLCEKFGDAVEFEGECLYTFPSAERVAGLSVECLNILRCGYRAEYIIGAAKAVTGGKIDLDALVKSPPDETRSALKNLHGIGDKVADCVMLFGFQMLDTFPRDVWMKRAVERYYGSDFDHKIFSPYAGIAQQYIFYYIRNC